MALWVRISTHAPHAGSDLLLGSVRPSCKHFNPRSPCGERHFLIEDDFLPVGISTHAPHAGSDVAPTPTPQPTTISTHAPHAGSDADNVYNAISAGQFQPTLPMRGATNYKPHYWRFCRFQPTLPMRGATLASACTAASNAHFNPRSPCGERLQHIVLLTISLPDIVKSHSRKQKRAS